MIKRDNCILNVKNALKGRTPEEKYANGLMVAAGPGYHSALKAIANMKINDDTDFRAVAALCIATADAALDKACPAQTLNNPEKG